MWFLPSLFLVSSLLKLQGFWMSWSQNLQQSRCQFLKNEHRFHLLPQIHYVYIYIYIYVVKAWLHLLDLSKNCYNIGTRLCDNWQLITISFREFYENLKSRDTFCLYTKYPPAICKKACTPFFFEHANIIGSWYEVMW